MKQPSILVIMIALAAACGDHSHGGAEVDAVYDDCAIEPLTYDEAFLALRDAQGREAVDAAKSPVMVAPVDGEMIAAATPPTLRWKTTATSMVAAAKGLRAHGCIVDGDIYWLRFKAGAETLHVLNLNTDWTVTDAVWAKLKAAPQPVTVTLVRAYMNKNRILEGPFKAASDTRFTVK